MVGYVTEEQIRNQVTASLQARVDIEEREYKEAKAAGKEYTRRFSLALLNTPQYEKWVSDRLADARRRNQLVTEQQLADIKNGRVLKEGDRARYVGPDRLEATTNGRHYRRVNGQTGTINRAVKGQDNQTIYTFMPDTSKAALDEHGPVVHVAQLQVKERTAGYFTLERIPK